MQSSAYTCVILGTPAKKFAIYTEPVVGKQMQMILAEEISPRPYTHNLVESIFKGLDIQVKQVVINKRDDAVYFARLFLEQQMGEEVHILEIDARPSDCILLALSKSAPVFCTREVLDQAIPVEDH